MNQLLKLSSVYSAIDKVTAPARKMMKSVGDLDNLAKKAKGIMEWGLKVAAGGTLADGAGQKIKATLQGLADPYFEYEKQVASLDQVIKTSGNNQVASLEAAKKAAKEWESVHGDSAASFIATTQKMSAANLKDVDAIRASRYAMGLAKGTMSETETATKLLTYGYENLGNKSNNAADEIRKQADMTAKLQQVYKMRDLAEFTDSMKDAIPAAALLGQKYEETSVAVATLQQAGWQGGKAGGSYAAILGQMEKASSELGVTLARNADGTMDFVGTIDNLSSKYGDLRKVTPAVRDQLRATFGDDGVRMLMVFQQQSGQMKKAMDDLRDSTGAMAVARDKMENTDFGRMQKSLQKLESFKVSIAERIFGNPRIMEEIIPKFISGVEWAVNLGLAFADANPNLLTAILTIGAIATALLLVVGPIMGVVGGLLTMAGTAVSACATALGAVSSFYSFVASGAALKKGQAIIRLLHIKYLAFSKSATAAGVAVKGFGARMAAAGKAAAISAAQGIKSATLGMLGMAKGAILTATTALPGLIAATWAWTAALLANPMTWVVLGIMALIGAIVLCIVYWDEIAAACGAAWEWIKQTAGNGIDFLMTLPGRYLDFLNQMASSFFDSGKKLWTTFADGILSVIKAPYNAVKNGLAFVDNLMPHSDAREGPLSKLTWSGQRLMTTFASGIPKGARELYNVMEGVFQKIPGLDDDPNPKPPFPVGGGGSRPTPIFDPSSGGSPWSLIPAGSGGSGGIHFNGPVRLEFPDVTEPEDFMVKLRELADEMGT